MIRGIMPKPSGPFAEAGVGGDDHAGAFVEFAEQVEQQCPAGRAERQIAQLIEDDEIKAQQAFGKLACLVHGLFLLQRVDQIDRREESDLFAVIFHCLNTQSSGDMGLAGAGTASLDHFTYVTEGVCLSDSGT